MPPRSVASNPNLAGARKGSIPSLSGAASSSTESLPASTYTAIPIKMTSVKQRARAFDQRAAAGQQNSGSPRTSPTPASPFLKNKSAGVHLALPLRRPSTAPNEGMPLSTSISEDSADDQAPEGNKASTVGMLESDDEELATRDDASAGEALHKVAEGSDEEEQDETPRQSTNYHAASDQISRNDSSRRADYSLKPRTYSPAATAGRKSSDSLVAPRLPELFFQGSAVDEAPSESRSGAPMRSPYSSPHRELERAGWENGPKFDSAGLTVPNTQYQGKTAESPQVVDDMDASNRSFFWHSPHDSMDETDEEAEAANQPNDFSSLPSRSKSSLTSATALGFGGPSDWEHFYGGDYETSELIDDTELYLSKKEREKSVRRDDVEPREPGYQLEAEEQEGTTESNGREALPLPTIEEHQENEDTDIVTQHIDYQTDLDGFARSPPPVTPAAILSPATPVIPVIPPTPTRSEALKSPITTVHKKTSKENIIHTPTSESEREEPSNTPSTDSLQTVDSDETKQSKQREIRSTSKTPPHELRLPSDKIDSVSDLVSGPTSPPADDPNASEITISMVLPPDFAPSTSSKGLMQGPKSPPLRVADTRKSVFPQGEELPNPYAGLSPIAKASMNRFIRMLREEEKAEADHDKYFIFINFLRHEMRLRATLYDMDDESELSVPSSARHSIMSATPANRKGRSPSTRQVPLSVPAEKVIAPMDPTTGRAQSMIASGAVLQMVVNDLKDAGDSTKIMDVQGATDEENVDAQSTARDENINKGAISQVQPSPEQVDQEQVLAHQTSLETLNRSIDFVAPRSSMISDTAALSSSVRLPEHNDTEQHSHATTPLPGAQILEHSLSVRSNESKPYDGDKATNRQSIYRPFSGMLRSSSSQRRASMESLSTVKSAERVPERKGTDPGLLIGATNEDLSSSKASKKNKAPNRSTNLLDPLLVVIPHNNVRREEARQLASLQFDMNNIVDDFSFIHKTVVAWDGGAKIKRERYEHERQQRMSENERRVDELFNDNEIGYGDISHLEEEFKRSESGKKAEEEREEVESFVSSVFDVVWARINFEMDQLMPLYLEATRLVADASAGRQMFDDTDERVPIAPIMEILLILYQKLMIRHQKAFEAVLERDRRLKKTEVSPWFAVGEFDKVKRIEKRFEDAERKAILEFCRQRDERANSLMDVLDQHTLRGVGANQDYMESVMQAVRKIALQIVVKGSGSAEKNLKPSADEVARAKLVTTALARSSEQIVRTFHVADMLLNAADYEVSVANARLSNADAAAFKRLRDAKTKEDAKLAADLEHRLGLIRSDTSRTQEEISKLMLLLGKRDDDLKFDISKERDKRMIAALEDAKSKLENLPPTPPAK